MPKMTPEEVNALLEKQSKAKTVHGHNAGVLLAWRKSGALSQERRQASIERWLEREREKEAQKGD